MGRDGRIRKQHSNVSRLSSGARCRYSGAPTIRASKNWNKLWFVFPKLCFQFLATKCAGPVCSIVISVTICSIPRLSIICNLTGSEHKPVQVRAASARNQLRALFARFNAVSHVIAPVQPGPPPPRNQHRQSGIRRCYLAPRFACSCHAAARCRQITVRSPAHGSAARRQPPVRLVALDRGLGVASAQAPIDDGCAASHYNFRF